MGLTKPRAGFAAAAAAVLVALAAHRFPWPDELERPAPSARRWTEQLPRTARVLDRKDAAYLAALYAEHNASWTQSYFNLLVRRWNTLDERLAEIFQKVVDAANALPGGGGDYMITSEFFSYRAPGMVHFAQGGAFHMDCDFWKVDAADGFNLWVLLDHHGLSEAFDVLEWDKNPELYESYTGVAPKHLLPQNGSDPNSAYATLILPPRRHVQGHQDALNWRASLQIARQLFWKAFARHVLRRQSPLRFDVPVPTATNVRLEVGEALVLREQELHRSDLHRRLRAGQYRLAVGFKMQRRGSNLTSFDLQCTAQKDRLNLPLLWEKVGDAVADVYREPPGAAPGTGTASTLVYLGLKDRLLSVAWANANTLVALGALAVALGPNGVSILNKRQATHLSLGTQFLLLGCVAALQWRWILSWPAPVLGQDARLRSSFLA